MPTPRIEFNVNEISDGLAEIMGDATDDTDLLDDTGSLPSRLDPGRVTLTAAQQAAIAAQEAAQGVEPSDDDTLTGETYTPGITNGRRPGNPCRSPPLNGVVR